MRVVPAVSLMPALIKVCTRVTEMDFLLIFSQKMFGCMFMKLAMCCRDKQALTVMRNQTIRQPFHHTKTKTIRVLCWWILFSYSWINTGFPLVKTLTTALANTNRQLFFLSMNISHYYVTLIAKVMSSSAIDHRLQCPEGITKTTPCPTTQWGKQILKCTETSCDSLVVWVSSQQQKYTI